MSTALGLVAPGPASSVAAVWGVSSNSLSRDGRFPDGRCENCRNFACGPNVRDTLDTTVSAMPVPQRAGVKRRRDGLDATDRSVHGARAGAPREEPVHVQASPSDAPVPSAGIAMRQARRLRVRWTDEETDELVRLHALCKARSRPGALFAAQSTSAESNPNLPTTPVAGSQLWSRILAAGWETFRHHERTNVDLKDRWRTLTKGHRRTSTLEL